MLSYEKVFRKNKFELEFIDTDDNATLRRRGKVWDLRKPVYKEEFVSSEWKPYGCPGGYINKKTGQTAVVGKRGWSYADGRPEWTHRNGSMYRLELIGWEKVKGPYII